jgi:hypothetical protein
VKWKRARSRSSGGAKDRPNRPVYFVCCEVYVAVPCRDEALSVPRRSIELRSTELSLYYQLARVYQKLGQPELAQFQFEKLKHLESAKA